MTPAPRLLFVHAHPDDETITTGGTIAAYSGRGADVRVVTCTLGEEGEVIGDEFAQLVAAEADQLGGYRVVELSRALAELGDGVTPAFLGGAGRWRDSGMAGTPSARNPRAFVNADPAEAVGALARVIVEFQPQVVVTYDPDGTYGHPDHIQAHTVTMAALDEAATLGWEVPKVYWTVTAHGPLQAALADLGPVPAGWRAPGPGELSAFPDSAVTTAVDVTSVLPAKRAALRAHATQVTVAPGGTMFALSNNIAQPVLDREFYLLVRGRLGERGADGWETDLLA